MKRYKVTITIEAVNTLAIEANSPDEAEMKAHELYYKTILPPPKVQDITIESEEKTCTDL